jgi:LDH2 family malate/lactate/ureidoglycolate dehydrogenase
MNPKRHLQPADTREFIALWNTVKEEHFVAQLVPLLPRLFNGSIELNAEQAEPAARHLVRAMHLAETPEAGVQAAITYLAEVAEGRTESNPTIASTARPPS